MDSQSGETVEQTKKNIKKGKRKWTDDEAQDLTELPEEKPWLWDNFANKSEKKELKKELVIIGGKF